MRKSSSHVWAVQPMKQRIKRLSACWRAKRPFFAAIGTTAGFAATVLFALYNGALGIWHASLWHGSIGIYYILLSLLRGMLLITARKAGKMDPQTAESCRRRAFGVTSGIMLAMNLALATPALLMVLDRRPVQTGLTPAIASAAYTTYKIAAAAAKLKRAKGTVLDRELSVIRLVDALVSVLVPQNTLIIAVEGGIPQRLFRLTAVSSAGLLLLIFVISAVWFARGFSLCRTGRL